MLGLQVANLTGLGALAAMLDDDKVPNEAAVELSPLVGWVFLVGMIATVAFFILNQERWRRWWLEREDPRSIGLYRIVFGFFVLANMNDFYEYFTFLFTDEGIFTADVARHVHARDQFKGFGDGFTDDEPWGFFDIHAVWEFAKGNKYSLLYFWDSPTAFTIHLWAFYIAAAMFIVGFRTRIAGVVTFLLMNSIFFRNHLFWEGTELVYRVFLAYLICAKAGHAYSVDNWLRCRKLRAAKLLSEPGGPGDGAGLAADEDEHPKGLQAIYRLIPAWPRRLMLIQMGFLYANTGILKNGSVWAQGDAIYYAWNMDHFYRFYPQQITALFGTSLLRVATWVTHWGEASFAIVLLSIFYWWNKSQGFAPATGLRKLGIRLCLLTLLGVVASLIWITWPVHYVPNFFGAGNDVEGTASRWIFVSLIVGVLLGLWFLWVRLGKRPIGTLTRLPRLLERLPVIKHIPGIGEPVPIDRDFVMKWVFGRRIWIVWHFSVMGGIFILMNIGQFQTAMLSNSIIFFTGLEVALFGRFIAVHAHRLIPKSTLGKILLFWFVWLPMLIVHVAPKAVRDGEPVVPAEDPTLAHHRRDAARLPHWAMVATALGILTAILVKTFGIMEANALKELTKAGMDKELAELEVNMGLIDFGEHWNFVAIGSVLFAAGVAFQRWRTDGKRTLAVEDPDSGVMRAPWAYGMFGRFVVNSLLVWHIAGVFIWLSPDKDSMSTWRPEARRVWAKWLTLTQTDQGWGMFAPNPPRSNVFLKVIVYDAAGEPWDMKSDVYAPERKPIPWIWNDRMRKMNRRIIGGESGNTEWYRKWFARWHCRQWALEHDGETPQRVELIKVWYKIPAPEQTFPFKWYSPEDLLERTGHEEVSHTEHCRNTVMGQLSDEIRARHGLPPLPEDLEYKQWIKHKRGPWEKERAKARGEEPPKPEKKDAGKAKRDKREADSGALERVKERRKRAEARAKKE